MTIEIGPNLEAALIIITVATTAAVSVWAFFGAVARRIG